MTPRYWLVIGVVAVETVQVAGCTSHFTSCDNPSSCGANEASAGQVEPGKPDETGDAGSAGSAPAGNLAGNGGVLTDGEGGAAGDAGAAGSMGGSSGGTPLPPALFGACSAAGRTVCAGVASAERLSCDGSKWQPGSVCPDGKLCDSSSGACAKIIGECTTVKPGDSVCRGDILLKCGPDLVSTDEAKPCDGVCKDGVCQAPTCGDQKLEAGEECEAATATAPGACVKCKFATCGDGVVFAGNNEECDDGNMVAGDGCSPSCHWEPVSISVGASSSCALSAAGTVKCWGDNQSGQLGQGNKDPVGDEEREIARMQPIDLGMGRTAKSVVVGAYDVCALLDNNTVKCWGDNSAGQLGQGDTHDRGGGPGQMGDYLPPVVLGEDAVYVTTGGAHACAILSHGAVKCWGSGAFGQLGYDSEQSVLSPALLPAVNLGPGRTAKDVSAANNAVTCALLDNSLAKCWGLNAYGVLSLPENIAGSEDGAFGNAPSEMASLPTLNFSGFTVKSISTTDRFACAVLSDDKVRCWGVNYRGALGAESNRGTNPSAMATLLPIPLDATNTVRSLSLGDAHACAVLTDGSVKCWGANSHGELGAGNNIDQGTESGQMGVNLKAVPLGVGRTARQVSIGLEHACALLDDGTVKCWGANDEGQLGAGDTLQRGDTPNFTLKAVELGF
jgi:cysteine-rich repeat protein